ncbi:branched-chain amino acid aminotransferase [Flammeovirga sp. SJP92]|uniref:branched-chain amino acid aminotransferase n=1 Tax=Flammeovirga sp. SJP92 TaxID=1775430 RepID=UPI000788CCCE|nr:branched-chain amino acid aminotransferase [Flammeovirga sp. SJP92]KXX69579.1 branched chain amino acid aminotransferase [Flammeovirga sp. SJP92]
MKDLTLDIRIEKTENSRLSTVDFNNIPFGKTMSDHMFVADYRDGKWQDLRVVPYDSFQLSPATSSLHYGQSIFEGLKAFRNAQNAEEVLVFRPEENAKRLNVSAERICMPTIPEEIFMEGLHTLLEIDREWVPNTPDSSLYIRPFMFATDSFLGMRPSETYTFAIITAPAGKYYSKALKLKVEKEFARTAPGGTGFAKVAGNYAASLLPAKLAAEQGYDQLLYTDAKERKYIEESGTMNVMFDIDGTFVTSPTIPVEDTILRSITRLTVIELLEEMGKKVEERHISVEEVITAIKEGRLNGAFGIGTAVTIAPFASIADEGIDYELPADYTFAQELKEKFQGIQKGEIEDTRGWTYKI